MKITRKLLKEKMWECANEEHSCVMFVFWAHPGRGRDPFISVWCLGTEEGIAERWISDILVRDTIGFFDMFTYDQSGTKSWFVPDSGMNLKDAVQAWHTAWGG